MHGVFRPGSTPLVNPAGRIDSLIRWTRRAALVGGAQTIVQLVGFIAGLLVIRLLTPEQYAYYTIANAALGAMSVLSDSGIGAGVLSEGGKIWQDRTKLGATIATGLELRQRFSWLAAAFAIPLVILLLEHQGAGWSTATLVGLSILPLFFLSMTGQLLEIVPRLHQDLLPPQRVQVLANVGRVALLGFLLPLWPLASLASILAAVPQVWANWQLRGIARGHADWDVPADPDVKSRLLIQVKRTLPGSIYYAVSGQLTVWLIAIFGQTSSIAAVGALGRLAMILSVLSSVFGSMVIPSFARIPHDEEARVVRRYWQSQVVLALACSLPVIALALFPEPVLAILGPSYQSLGREAALMASSAGVSIIAGSAFSLGASRGVIAPPRAAIAYFVGMQMLLIWLLPVDTVQGVLWLGLLSAVSQWVLHVAYFVYVQRRRAG